MRAELAMNLDRAETIVHRHLVTGRPLATAPRYVRRALKICDRHHEARKGRNEPEQFCLALDVYDEVLAKGEAYKRRAMVRKRLADYIDDVVLPEHWDLRLSTAADKLRKARSKACYGYHEDGTLVTCWDDKSGLSKLDPDESREESRRLADRYGTHVKKLVDQGKGLHYLMLSVPNVEAGALAETQQAFFRKWINLKRTQVNKKKAFPEILGDLAVMEAPLAADGTWNVHLNVLMVTEKPFCEGLYQRIREEWKAHAYMKPIAGDAIDIARTFNELIKYGTRAVPEKSLDKASRHKTDAPPMIEWPVSRFFEWFDAQSGFRRTRTYGCLYGSKVPKPEPRSLDDVTWLGVMSLGPDYFRVALPLLAETVISIPGDNSTTNHRRPPTTGPP